MLTHGCSGGDPEGRAHVLAAAHAEAGDNQGAHASAQEVVAGQHALGAARKVLHQEGADWTGRRRWKRGRKVERGSTTVESGHKPATT